MEWLDLGGRQLYVPEDGNIDRGRGCVCIGRDCDDKVIPSGMGNVYADIDSKPDKSDIRYWIGGNW